MGIYLPNMEMPQPGEAITIFCSGDAHRFIIGMRESLTKSKAIPVPNHGRLIDADALPWEKQGLMLTDPDEWGIEARDIEAAPIIIPADPAEEGE